MYMNTIVAKIPAYGMPVLEGPATPEKVSMMPPMGDMPGPDAPGGPGGPMPGGPKESKERA